MKSVVKTIRFPLDILEEIRPMMDKTNLNFTKFITEAIKVYMRILEYTEVVNKSFGIWKKSKHPELAKGVNSYIRQMRKGR
jgi:hypothetical protein